MTTTSGASSLAGGARDCPSARLRDFKCVAINHRMLETMG